MELKNVFIDAKKSLGNITFDRRSSCFEFSVKVQALQS